MKVYSDFLILLILSVSLSKSTQKHNNHDSKSLEGDILIDRILAADKFSELADKIIEKTIAKLNDQQLTVVPNSPAIETKKSNDFKSYRGLEFKSLKNAEKKDVKLIKTTKSQKKLKRYKPGKINIEAVMKKTILPSNDLTFSYNRFTKSVTTVSDKLLPQKKDVDKLEHLNEEPEDEQSTTKHKVIKKPSANASSKEQNISGTDTETKSEENDHLQKNTPNDRSVESTKFAEDSEITHVTKSTNDDNPFGNEKTIVWNKKDSDSEDSSASKSDEKNSVKEEKTSLPVTQKIEGKKQTSDKTRYLFRSDTLTEPTPNNSGLNKVDDDDDYQARDKDLQIKLEDVQNRTKQLIRREGNKTYVLEDSPDYKEYHEQLAKVKKIE